MLAFLALWTTNGLRNLDISNTTAFWPLLWAIAVLGLGFLFYSTSTNLALALQNRTRAEIFGRGLICGIMISLVWAFGYLLTLFLKEIQWIKIQYEVFLLLIGILVGFLICAHGISSECFLRENLVAIGWLTGVIGMAVWGKARPILGNSFAIAGVSLVLIVTLVSGKIRLHSRGFGYYEVSRERTPVQFFIVMIGLLSIISMLIYCFVH